MNSLRQEKVSQEIKRHLAKMITEGSWLLRGYEFLPITISQVTCSSDFAHAKVYYTYLAGSRDLKLEGELKNVAPQLSKELGRVLKLRNTPKLKFIYDNSFEEAQKIETLLFQVNKNSNVENAEE